MKNRQRLIQVGAITLGLTLYGFHFGLACEENPGKLTISVAGAQSTSTPNLYIVQIPDDGETVVTITGSGSTPCTTDEEKCTCDEDTAQSAAPTTDGTPVYTFDKPAASQQNPSDGPTIEWRASGSTTPGEHKFKLKEIKQNYLPCADGWSGGVSFKSNTQASDEVTIFATRLEPEGTRNENYSKKIYYLGTVEKPEPADFNKKSYKVLGLGNPDESKMMWASEPSGKVTFEKTSATEANATALADNGTNTTKIIAKYDGVTVGTYDERIRTKGTVERNTNYDLYLYTNTLLKTGYKCLIGVKFKDNFGKEMSDIGLNEFLDWPGATKHWSDTNWLNGSKETRNTILDASGSAVDRFEIFGVASFLTPIPVNDSISDSDTSVPICDVPQEYRLGSEKTGDGLLFSKHSIMFRRGHAYVFSRGIW